MRNPDYNRDTSISTTSLTPRARTFISIHDDDPGNSTAPSSARKNLQENQDTVILYTRGCFCYTYKASLLGGSNLPERRCAKEAAVTGPATMRSGPFHQYNDEIIPLV